MPIPCAYRRNEVSRQGCTTCGGNIQIKVYGCELHGECTLGPDKLPGIRGCAGCADNTEKTPVTLTPPTPHTHAAHRALLLDNLARRTNGRSAQPTPDLVAEFEMAAANIPDTPAPKEPHGVLYVAGGWRFFPSLYVSVKMLRASGCDWPIAVRYFAARGEFEPRMAELLPEVDQWLAIEAIGWPAPFRPGTPGGWQAKPLCLLHSPFRRTIYMDADCYPIRDPAEALAGVDGAAFWPDIPLGVGFMTPGHFAALGMPFHDDRNWETGQIMVDQGNEEQRRALWLAAWLAFRPDSHRWSHGDCGCFQMAYRRLGTPHWQHAGRPGMADSEAKWEGVAFIHIAPDGHPLFIHRCRDKFRVTGHHKSFTTPQSNGDAQFYCPTIPGEDLAHGFYNKLIEKL